MIYINIYVIYINIYLIFQEAGRGIICLCYVTLKTPSIQTAWSMYHGFIAEGALVNNGKQIYLTTLAYPLSPLENYFFLFLRLLSSFVYMHNRCTPGQIYLYLRKRNFCLNRNLTIFFAFMYRSIFH